MTEKVKVSREVAEAIEELYADGYDKESLVEDFILNRSNFEHIPVFVELENDTLIRALYVGYEIQLTPEEELAEYIRSDRFNACTDPFGKDHDYYVGRIAGARKAAEILGVKLPERTDAN